MVDFSINKDEVILTGDVELVIQQLDLLFDTNTNEVFAEEYGTWFEEFLYDLNISNSYISEYTKNMIVNNVNLMGFNVDVNTQLCAGTEHDIILVSIDLKRDYEEYSKTYKLS